MPRFGKLFVFASPMNVLVRVFGRRHWISGRTLVADNYESERDMIRFLGALTVEGLRLKAMR